VIDEQRATLYLDAAIMRANGPRHEIFALSLTDGSIERGWPLDVAATLGASFDPSVQNQRGALALFKGKVFVPFSGHWGDCGAYHGFVVDANCLTCRRIWEPRKPPQLARTFLVERRGFEPLTSAVRAPARLTGSSLLFLRGSSATARAGLSPKPVPAPAECDRSAPRSATAAWRKQRPFADGVAPG
jgi:hypothetical protein